MSVKSLFDSTKQKDYAVIGRIVQKEGNRYVIQDKRERQYSVRSVLSFEVGRTVISKNGIILNTVNNLETFKSFIV
jgi:hypothetical protein